MLNTAVFKKPLMCGCCLSLSGASFDFFCQKKNIVNSTINIAERPTSSLRILPGG